MVKETEKRLEEIKKEAEERKCPVQRSLYYIREFLAGPMCGRCFPCEMGSYEAEIRLEKIMEGNGSEGDISALRRIGSEMFESSMCKKGKDTARFILEWMETDSFKKHIEGICPDRECLAFIEYRIIPKNCIMCGLCQDVCRYNAVLGDKRMPYKSGYPPYEIRQRRCTKCGDCIKVCPTEAIVIVDAKEAELAEAK